MLADAILEDAPELVATRHQLSNWLTDDKVIDWLTIGSSDGLTQASLSLATILRDESRDRVSPSVAKVHCERAVASATATVLLTAEDKHVRWAGETLRIVARLGRQQEDLASNVRALMHAQAVQDDDLQEIVRIARELAGAPVPGAPTVLFADDQPGMTEGLARRLRERGRNVLAARTVREALNLLAESDIAVVVVDMMLPLVGITDVLEGDDAARSTFDELNSQMGGQELLRRLPAINSGATAIVFSILSPNQEEGETLVEDSDWFLKTSDHRPLLRRILELTGDH